MAEHATARNSGACVVRFEAASQLDGESSDGPTMIACPSDDLFLLSMSVLPHTS